MCLDRLEADEEVASCEFAALLRATEACSPLTVRSAGQLLQAGHAGTRRHRTSWGGTWPRPGCQPDVVTDQWCVLQPEPRPQNVLDTSSLRVSRIVRRNLEAEVAAAATEYGAASVGAGAADVKLHTADAEVDFDERASDAGELGAEA